ncbi:MAG TPA: hypothetical protein VE631_09540 [Alphaproteobacteria bacterium]|jgi:hypothetical protein|nr:hypothetical protein [Alphaproteobacteria bacterium]
MVRITALAAALACAALLAGGPAAAKPSQDEVKSCLKMIRDMVGVEPSPKVAGFCAEGKRDEAMKAAMAGE